MSTDHTMARSLAEDFFARCDMQPNHPAILGPQDLTTSYRELAERVRRMASTLEAHGVTSGMNVGLHYPSGTMYIVFTYAVWTIGACITPIPTELTDVEKRQIVRDIAIDGIISGQRSHSILVNGDADLAERTASITSDAVFIAGTRNAEPPLGLEAIHAAFIRFTSGTSGSAKGVVLSHQTIRDRIGAANTILTVGPEDRVVWMLSMAYHFAVTIVAYLSYGATIVLPANTFGQSILHAAREHDATIIYGSPTHFELMCQDDSGMALPPLRYCIVTTARVRPELAQRFVDRFGMALNETYGIIEIGLPSINHDRPGERQGSVGRVLPAYELRLERDGGSAAPDADGTVTGEVLLRGPGMLDAYYAPWRTRDEILAVRDGWLATGDLGRLDDGYLSLVGRTKDLISVNGMKFFPQEVERVLEHFPGVQEVCVYGVADKRQGEVAEADLVLAADAIEPDHAALTHYCRERLAAYKIPRRFHTVEALSRTASGKVLRRLKKELEPLDV